MSDHLPRELTVLLHSGRPPPLSTLVSYETIVIGVIGELCCRQEDGRRLTWWMHILRSQIALQQAQLLAELSTDTEQQREMLALAVGEASWANPYHEGNAIVWPQESMAARLGVRSAVQQLLDRNDPLEHGFWIGRLLTLEGSQEIVTLDRPGEHFQIEVRFDGSVSGSRVHP